MFALVVDKNWATLYPYDSDYAVIEFRRNINCSESFYMSHQHFFKLLPHLTFGTIDLQRVPRSVLDPLMQESNNDGGYRLPTYLIKSDPKRRVYAQDQAQYRPSNCFTAFDNTEAFKAFCKELGVSLFTLKVEMKLLRSYYPV